MASTEWPLGPKGDFAGQSETFEKPLKIKGFAYRLLEMLPPMGGFFLAPAEAYSFLLQQNGLKGDFSGRPETFEKPLKIKGFA